MVNTINDKKIVDYKNSFEECRSERRSFWCSNVLWKEIAKRTNNNISVSKFIKQAIKEKLNKKS